MVYTLPTSFYRDIETGKIMCELSLVESNDDIKGTKVITLEELKSFRIQNKYCRFNTNRVEWQGHVWDSIDELLDLVEIAVLRANAKHIEELDAETERLMNCSPEHRKQLLQLERESFERKLVDRKQKEWEEAQKELIKDSNSSGIRQYGE